VALDEEISQYQLANWEYGRTRNPNMTVLAAIEYQIREWRREDGAVQEAGSAYGTPCPTCLQLVPGPDAGAKYCMLCGARFDSRVCSGCGVAETRPDVRYCGQCGARLPK